MTVVQYEQPAPLPPTRASDELETGPTGWVARLRAAAEIANYVGETEFVPEPLRGRHAAIAAAILTGGELGLQPMRALAWIALIQGKPAMLAEGQRAMILAEGHEIWFEESTTTRAICAGRRRGEERVGRITWTMDDAKRANLSGKPPWRAYPAEMLRARASAALARAMFPDVLGGLAAVEELDSDTDDNGAAPPAALPTPPADVPPAAAAPKTRRRARAATPTPTAAEPAAAPEPAQEPARPALPPTPPPDDQPDPEPGDAPPATDAMRRKIFALMRDLGIADRQERLDVTAAAIGRTIESSTALTMTDADLLIRELERRAANPEPDPEPAENERAVVAALEQELDAEQVDAAAGDPGREPVPYNEFPPGF